MEAETQRGEIQTRNHAFERIVDADDAHVLGNTFAGGLQSEHGSIGHLVVRRVHRGARFLMGKRQTGLVAAVGLPVADVDGGYRGSGLRQRVVPPSDAALRGSGHGWPGDVVHGAMPLGEHVVHGGRGTAVRIGIDGDAIVGRFLGNQHDGKTLRRLELVEIGEVPLHDDDHAVKGKVLHKFQRAGQGTVLQIVERAYGRGIALLCGGADDAFKDACVAKSRHMGKQYADVVEPPAFQGSGGVIRSVSKLFHGDFDLVACFRSDGGTAVRDT